MQLAVLVCLICHVVAPVPADVANHAVPPPLLDLQRARERVPRPAWKGHSFADMSSKLTTSLRRSGHNVKHCDQWTTTELRGLQLRLLDEADENLLAVYKSNGDSRKRRLESREAWKAQWNAVELATAEASSHPSTTHLGGVLRDGLCHEVVMWWAHHLPTAAQHRLTREGVTIPSLPKRRHDTSSDAHKNSSVAVQKVLEEYAQQVSCQQCHTGSMPEWQNATLPVPLPVDLAHPGLERKRACDFQNVPLCGPCDGLGGKRTGDGVEEFVPMPCEVVVGPEAGPITRGEYPPLATAHISGGMRTPLAVIPTEPGHYKQLQGNLSLGWQGEFMRMRYDFGVGSQVSVQTFEQARQGNVGATIGLFSGQCTCHQSIAGNMHIHSFEADDPLDHLQLPPEAGGATYLGRVRITLDGERPESSRVAVADHYMKWAFHFLVDADPASPSFGLPLRLYAPWGVLQVFDGWKVGDPAAARPDIWKLPQGCKVSADECSVFDTEGPESELVI